MSLTYRRCVSVQNPAQTAYWAVAENRHIFRLESGPVYIVPGQVLIWHPNGFQEHPGEILFDTITKDHFNNFWIDEAHVPEGTKARAHLDAMPDYETWVKATHEKQPRMVRQ